MIKLELTLDELDFIEGSLEIAEQGDHLHGEVLELANRLRAKIKAAAVEIAA